MYSGGTVKSEIMPNQQLAEELPKPIIRNLRIFFRIIEKRKINSPFKDNTLGADFTDMQLISKHNKCFWFLLCVIDTFSKYAWVVPVKDKKVISIANPFK